jgi:hypothetical protein
MEKDNDVKTKNRNLRYVIYFCGCRLDNVSVFPQICPDHGEGIRVTGPYYLRGESKQIDPRHLC